MSDRIVSQEEDLSEEIEEKTEKPQKPADTNPLFPKGYVNPFDDPDNEAEDNYPFIFSDVDFDLKQSPRIFAGFEKPEIRKEIEEAIKGDEMSKSANNRIWQYTRWKTWKYLYELPKREAVLNLSDNEEAGKARGTVRINGVTFWILKGTYIPMPSDIAEMIKVSQNQTNMAGKKSLLTSLSQKLDPVTGLPKDRNRLER